jgi:ribosomal protein L37AE/L43A
MAVIDGQSWAFWARRDKSHLTTSSNDVDRPNLDARPSEISELSRLTDELSDHEQDAVSGDDRSKVHCMQCGSEEFKIKFTSGEKVLVCVKCGKIVDDGADDGGTRQATDRNAYRRFYT